MTQVFDAIVIGGGAAGLMCAAEIGRRGRNVVVLERAEVPGKKILISGGGRCNFTNLDTAPDRFISANPHFAKSALSRYTPRDFLALVESHGIAWHEKTLGQLFCDGSSRQIVDMLLGEVEKGRRNAGPKDRIEVEGITLQEAVAAGYRELAARYSERIRVIPAQGSVEQVHRQVMDEVERLV